MMHPAKKGINLVRCVAYIYFVLKDVFFIVLKLQKSPTATAKMEDVLRIKYTKNDRLINLLLILWCTRLYLLPYYYERARSAKRVSN